MESCLLHGRTQAHACVPRPVHGPSHFINELSDQIERIDWPKNGGICMLMFTATHHRKQFPLVYTTVSCHKRPAGRVQT